MKRFFAGAMLLTGICLGLSYTAHAQPKQGQARLDSLLAEVPRMKEDTAGVKLLYDITNTFRGRNEEEAMRYAIRQQTLAKKIGWRKGELLAANAIGNTKVNVGAYPDALDAFLNGLRIAEAIGDQEYTGVLSGSVALVYLNTNDYDLAENYALTQLKIAEELNLLRRIRFAQQRLSTIYVFQKRYREALDIQMKLLRTAEALGDKEAIATQSSNIAVTYGYMQEHNSALRYHFQALRISREIGMAGDDANTLNNIGIVYRNIGTDSTEPRPDSLVPATRAENLAKAIEYINLAVPAMRAVGQARHLSSAFTNLSSSYAALGDYRAALQTYKDAVTAFDSIHNKENNTRIVRAEETYKFSRRADSLKWEADKRTLAIQKETELAALAAEYAKKQAAAKTEKERQQLLFEEDLKRQQIASSYREKEATAATAFAKKSTLAKAEEEKRAALTASDIRRQKTIGLAAAGGGVILLVIAVIAFRAFRQRRASNLVIAGEREKSEALLRNILPAEVAEELKDTGGTQAKQYNAVSVLFTDFVDFTETSERLSPTALVKELHECFSAFDAIIEKHGLEKIKTIGDAYMAVCGLPNEDPRHAQKCVAAAIDIRDFIEQRRRRERVFDIRIGINSGPVVAGIVGVKKFAYDIWGDTVNTASRVEGHSEPGKINISQSTYELVRDDYACTPRGTVAAKGKGEMSMYFVELKAGRKAHAKTVAA